MNEKNEQASAGIASTLNAELDVVGKAVLVEVYPTRIWVDSGFDGVKRIMMQHQGCEAFEFVAIKYDYRYTSNSMQHALVKNILSFLGVDG